MSLLSIFTERHELLANLVSRELKSRYKGSILGFLWTLLTPLFMAVIYVVFLRMLAGGGVPIEEIIIGVFAWQFTAMCVTGGMTSITGNSNLVKKVFFPRIVLPTAVTLANLVNFLLSLVIQFAITFVLLRMRGLNLDAATPLVLAVIAYHTMFNLSLALLMAASNVYFRDTQHLVGVLLSAWFFVSPVMYNLSFVEKAAAAFPLLSKLYLLNPAALIITAYRAMILPDVAFPVNAVTLTGLALPVLLMAVAYVVFRKAQRNFADLL